MTNYNPTDHAVERYKTRVGGRGNDEQLRHHATEWFNRAMKVAEYLGKGRNDTLMYRYKQYLIIVSGDGENIVTISYYNQSYSEVVKEITTTLRESILATLDPLRQQERELLIEMHRREINRLECDEEHLMHVIEHGIESVNRRIMAVQHSIYDLEKLAEVNDITL